MVGQAKTSTPLLLIKEKKVLIIQRGPLIDPMSSKDDVTSTETIACNSKTAKSISRAIY